MKDTKEENSSSKKRTIIIKGVNPFVPIIDIYTQLIKFTGEIKKISIVHNPSFPGISLGIFQIDYIDHQSALNAIKIINEEKKLSMIEGNIFASFSDFSKDNLTQIMIDSSHVLSFENLNINVINALEFKNYLNQYLKSNGNSSIQILKLRQYSNKIVIVFNEFPSCLKEFVDNEKNYFTYKSKNIPIKPMIKPIVNIGKYKEKTIKLSLFSLTEKDKKRIVNRINKGKNFNEEIALKKKAETLYNQIIDEERREQEREREEYNLRHSMNKKRERENSERKRYSNRNDDYINRNNNNNNNNNNNDLNGGLTQLANLLTNPAISQILQLLSNQDLDINKLKNEQNQNNNNLNLNNNQSNNQNLQNQINLNQNNQNLNNTTLSQLPTRNIMEENNINLKLPNNNINNTNIIKQENNANHNLNNPQHLQNVYFQQPNLNSIIANNPQLLSLIQNYETHLQQINPNNILNNPNLIPTISNNQNNNPIPQNQGQILNNMTNNNPQIPFNPMFPWNYM